MPHWNKGESKPLDWLKEHIGHTGSACLIWPFGRSRGYGVLGYEGGTAKAHRLMCEFKHGPAPTPLHHAAHNCGNGRGGCVHPEHLEWKTASENCLDRRRHGTHATNKTGSRSPLTEAQRQEILSLKDRLSIQKIANKFGISRQTVARIHAGRQYKPPGTHRETIRKRLKKLQMKTA